MDQANHRERLTDRMRRPVRGTGIDNDHMMFERQEVKDTFQRGQEGFSTVESRYDDGGGHNFERLKKFSETLKISVTQADYPGEESYRCSTRGW